MSSFNFYGVKTIFFFELKYFFKEFQYTILAPLINTILFLFIMSVISKNYFFNGDDISYLEFVLPGIIIMVIMQTSYNHISELIINMKQIGSFNDYLMSPMSRIEIALSFLFTSIVIGFIITIINIFVLSFFISFQLNNLHLLIFHITLTVIIFTSLGGITGILSYTWDTQSTISNFVIVPISFLSGTFFSIDAVNNSWKFIFYYNPFYYLVNNFRSSFLHDNNENINNKFYLFLLSLLILFFFLYIFKKGYRVII